MPHFFIKSENISNNSIVINDEDNFRHIAKSLRTKVGEDILLIDENQIQYLAKIIEIDKKNITANIFESWKSNRKLNFELYLAQSPLRSDAQNTIVEKATELGVYGIYPIYTDNCALNKNLISNKIEKWQRIMYEASKQCERAFIPKCFSLTSIEELVENGKFDYIITFCERLAKKTFRNFVEEHKNIFDDCSKVLIIIGPEGGFSKREFEYFENKNLPMLTLGDLILKAETAVITAIGNIIYEYNCTRKN
jgi:16S rRNA (uracil1498-N3)-methyltransferase